MEKFETLNLKVSKIKEILKEISKGKNLDELKERFKELLRSVKPWEIPIVEQELVRGGISPKEIAKMCDVHVELFRESIIDQSKFRNISAGHPLDTFLKENEQLYKDISLLRVYVSSLLNVKDENQRKEILDYVKLIIHDLFDIKKHFTRLQMLIFPYIERRGITAVPTVMWTKQDQIMLKLKKLKVLIESTPYDWNTFVNTVKDLSEDLIKAINDQIFRENNILFPTLNVLLSEGEWVAIKNQEPIIGYYKIEPSNDWKPSAEPIHPYQISEEISQEQYEQLPAELKALLPKQKNEKDAYNLIRAGDIELSSGYLKPNEINAILNSLPADITFIDKEDHVRFFSRSGARIFARTLSVLGRNVRFCHPPRSVHIVQRIIKEFKLGRRDIAEFWINIGRKLVYIRYFPVKDENGEYLGTLEVVQDITKIKQLKGEKRLLD
ncbi:MAG: DUF438 domain-containing protein [Candidatus Njordarchaeales archaeon]